MRMTSSSRPILPFALLPGRRWSARAARPARAPATEYCLTQLTMSLYYAIVVIGLCLVMGYAGQVSLGHGAFFAIGGYTSAVLTTHDFSAFKAAAWAGWLKQAHRVRREGGPVRQRDPDRHAVGRLPGRHARDVRHRRC